MNLKLIAYGIALVAVLGFAGWINHLVSSNKDLSQKLTAAELSRDTAIAGGVLYQQQNEKQEAIIGDYQRQLDEKQISNTNLERDVADGRKRLLVKGASCPKSATSANPVTTDTSPIYSADFRRNLFSIRSGIIKLEANYALCLSTLNEWQNSYLK